MHDAPPPPPPARPMDPDRLLTFGVVYELGMGLAALVVGWLMGLDVAGDMRFTWAMVGWGIAASLPPLAVAWLLYQVPRGPLARLREIVQRTIVPWFARCGWLHLLVLSLAAGLGEELLFRGLIQRGLAGWLPDWVALVLASVLFGLAHPITRTYIVLAGAIGGYLGWTWMVSGNLVVPIVAHAAYDFAALWYFVHQYRGEHAGVVPDPAEEDER